MYLQYTVGTHSITDSPRSCGTLLSYPRYSYLGTYLLRRRVLAFLLALPRPSRGTNVLLYIHST